MDCSLLGLPEPFSQRLPVMKRRPLPKLLIVSRQLFEHLPQWALVCFTFRLSISSRESRPEVPAAPARSRARRAAPYAPIVPAMSGLITSRPVSSSNARSVASLMNVPPCTTTYLPISS